MRGHYEVDILIKIRNVILFLFGNENTNILFALMALTVLDYITGVCVAIRNKTLSSAIGAKGIANKVVVFVLVSLSNIIGTYFLQAGSALEALTILFYCSNESISILENACKIGIPIPEKLKNVLEELKGNNM